MDAEMCPGINARDSKVYSVGVIFLASRVTFPLWTIDWWKTFTTKKYSILQVRETPISNEGTKSTSIKYIEVIQTGTKSYIKYISDKKKEFKRFIPLQTKKK